MSSLGLWMIWMILDHELRVVDDMNDMNDSKLWAHNSRYDEQLKVVVDMNDFESWPQDCGCYE